MKFHNNFILLVLFSGIISAQINIRSIENFNAENGLNQNSVHAIFQDSRGLLWLGTEGGINKYDGYDIMPYHSVNSKNILSSRGTIFSMLEDSNGDLWYGSTGVLSRLNIHTESSENFGQLLKDKFNINFGVVLDIFQDSKNNIWFGTYGQGFFKVSADFTSVKNYMNDPDSTGNSSLNYVRDIYEDESGIFWLATYGGIVKFNPITESIRNVFHEQNHNRYKHTTIFKLLPYENELMLFTAAKGILKFNTKTDSVCEYDEKINEKFSEFSLRNGIIDKNGNIWTCAYGGGVFLINTKNKSVINLADYVDGEFHRPLYEPLSLLIDNTGIIWVGTQHDGLFKIILGEKHINSIHSLDEGFNKIEDIVTNAVAKDHNGKIWLATNTGLFKINPHSKYVEKLSISEEFSPFVLKIFNIEFSNNYAWISLGSNLIKYDLEKDRYQKIEIEKNSGVTEVFIPTDDEIILGTSTGNLYFYTPSNGDIKSISMNHSTTLQNSILDCYLDSENKLWVGTNNGLYSVDLNKDSLFAEKLQLNLRLDFITSLTSYDNNKLWFTTYGDGLYAYNFKTTELEHFSHQDGLPDNTVYGAMLDDKQNLWMSSNRGIFEFDIRNYAVRTMDVTDGLQGYEYNSKAYSKSEDGELFYGGINGFDYFYPMNIERNEIPPPMLISKVSLYDSVVVSNISKEFNDIYEFNYDENSISFEFAALDYTNPKKNIYEYKLEGVNPNWIKAGSKRYATFPNINPGEYRFRVRGSNNDQIFNEEGVSFAFIINPPYWQTWWFRLVLLTLGILIIYSIYKFRMLNQERRLREIESVRRRIADDFHDDLGHKLTRISLYSEMIRKQDELGTNHKLYLDKISEASNSLFYETKDFIWSIDPGNDSVYDVLIYLKDFGDDFFNRSGIAFKVDEINEKFKRYNLPMKWKREIILIFKEAMNNVIKHSGGSTAELSTEISNSSLIISLYDDGHGFDPENTNTNGRGLSSIEKRAKVVEGKTNISSNSSGTTVKLTLKMIEGKK